jgi:hypothetical protein
MNRISKSLARRYRLLHATFFGCVLLAFLGLLLPFVLPPAPPDWLLLIPAIWFFGLITIGAVGMWTVGHRLLGILDPDPGTRSRVVAVSWIRPVGTFLAVNELLRSAEEK